MLDFTRYIKADDFFNSGLQVLANPVNCQGIMGAGLAKQFKVRYPEMFKQYESDCKEGLYMPGCIKLYTPEKGQQVLNVATKFIWRDESRIEFIESILINFKTTYEELAITSIAFPKIGCGLGGLDWNEVKRLFSKYLDDVKCSILVFE